jgi:hypothetical protein
MRKNNRTIWSTSLKYIIDVENYNFPGVRAPFPGVRSSFTFVNHFTKFNNVCFAPLVITRKFSNVRKNKIRGVLSQLNIVPRNDKVTQKYIEETLYDNFKELFSTKKKDVLVYGVNPEFIGSALHKYITHKTPEIFVYIRKLMNLKETKSSKKEDILYHNILQSLDQKFIYQQCILTFLQVYTNEHTDNDKNRVLVPVVVSLGKRIVSFYINHIKALYIKNKGLDFISYSDFRSTWGENNPEFLTLSMDDSFISKLGTRIIEILITNDMLRTSLILIPDSKKKKMKHNILEVSDNTFINKRRPCVFQLSMRLPMVCEPLKYTAEKLGGYLLNNDKYKENLFIEKKRYRHDSQLSTDIVYNMVNKTSATPYKVNLELLSYIVMYGIEQGLIMDPEARHEFESLDYLKAHQKKKLASFNSKMLLQETILDIAELFSKFPRFYFPVRIDVRGRLYCTPTYFNYQSNELAKALILFAEPSKIQKTDTTSIEYLICYGVNCFGGKVSKQSINDKLEHLIDKAIFIAGKTYWLCNDKGVFVNKAKGIKSTSLSYFDYIKLLNNKNINTAIKRESKMNWALGDVKIQDKNVTITSTGYTKRNKIFIQNNWVNTAPLIINQIDKSVVPYYNNRSLIIRKQIDKSVVPYYNNRSLIINTAPLITKDIDNSLKYNNTRSIITSTHNKTIYKSIENSFDMYSGLFFTLWLNILLVIASISYIISEALTSEENDVDLDDIDLINIKHIVENRIVEKPILSTWEKPTISICDKAVYLESKPVYLEPKHVYLETKPMLSIWEKYFVTENVSIEKDKFLNINNYKELEETKPMYLEGVKQLNRDWEIVTQKIVEDVLSNNTQISTKKEFMIYFDLLISDKNPRIQEKLWSKLEESNEFIEHILLPKLERSDSAINMEKAGHNLTDYWKIKTSAWDDKHYKIILDKEIDESMDKTNRNKLSIKTKIDEYIYELNKETLKSPNSSNLKTYVKIFGHEAAYAYFQTEDYKNRKEFLDNRNPQELAIQRSRHYIENRDYSPTPPIKLLKDIMDEELSKDYIKDNKSDKDK